MIQTKTQMEHKHPKLEITDELTDETVDKNIRGRLWRLFNQTEITDGENIIVIMQEPLYIDSNVESTIIKVYDFFIDNQSKLNDSLKEISKIYFFNNSCIRKKDEKKVQEKLANFHNENKKNLEKIIKEKKVKYIIDARGKLYKKNKAFKNDDLTNIIVKNDCERLSFKREEIDYKDYLYFYPGDRRKKMNGLLKVELNVLIKL
ncbi:MAG: hypothetical protein ACRCZW_13200 [Lactobacillaceae bacterium]